MLPYINNILVHIPYIIALSKPLQKKSGRQETVQGAIQIREELISSLGMYIISRYVNFVNLTLLQYKGNIRTAIAVLLYKV